MSENKKPRLAEVLGVEVGEKFRIADYPVDYGYVAVCADGKVRRVRPNLPDAHGDKIGANALYHIINHPEYIKRCPRWTEQDVMDARAIKRVFPDADYVFRPTQEVLFLGRRCVIKEQRINHNMFKGLNSGEAAAFLDDILGGRE